MSNLYLKEHHRLYDGFFPDRYPQTNRALDVYYDQAVMDYKGGTAIAILMEPKSMIGDAYEYLAKNADKFRYIFTHNSELLNLPNARYFSWADVWHTSNAVKDKGIQIISSWKNWCPLHIARIELAKYFYNKPEVDTFGSFMDKEAYVDTATSHESYKFAIVVENDIDEYWYTEKILNCFSNRVVPIYVGATRIGDIFNADGIIQVHDWHLIPEIVRTLDVDAEYEKRLPAIDDNFKRVIPYTVKWTDRFMNDYEELLEELLDGK